MDPVSMLLVLWGLFAGTHALLSSAALRPGLIAHIGDRGFLGLYSLVAFATFVPLVVYYGSHRHLGPVLWVPTSVHVGIASLLAVIGFVLVAAGVLAPSPAVVVGGRPEPRGAHFLTRHPLFMGIALWALAHLVANGFASDAVFFGGFALFSVLGAWHQDRRKLASGDPAFRSFWEQTRFWPLTGQTMRGLREFPLPALGVGIVAAVVIRAAHPWLFG